MEKVVWFITLWFTSFGAGWVIGRAAGMKDWNDLTIGIVLILVVALIIQTRFLAESPKPQ